MRISRGDDGSAVGSAASESFPAILFLSAFPIGAIAYLPVLAVAAVARSRSLAYGALCSLLVVPGLAVGLLHP